MVVVLSMSIMFLSFTFIVTISVFGRDDPACAFAGLILCLNVNSFFLKNSVDSWKAHSNSVVRMYHLCNCPGVVPSPRFPVSITCLPRVGFSPHLNWSTRAISLNPVRCAQPLNSVM